MAERALIAQQRPANLAGEVPKDDCKPIGGAQPSLYPLVF